MQFCINFKKYLNFFSCKKNNSGRNIKTGKILVWSKGKMVKKYLYQNSYFLKIINFGGIGLVVNVSINRKKLDAGLKNECGIISKIPLINGVFLGEYFFFFFKNLKFDYFLGKKTFLITSPANFFISNVGSYGFNHRSWLAKSNGTFCFKKNLLIDFSMVLVMMPSKKKKIINWLDTCYIGRNSRVYWKYRIVGNFSGNFYFGKKQLVRGVAMNPVDHPHGGRTKTNKPERSPWGWITKKSH